MRRNQQGAVAVAEQRAVPTLDVVGEEHYKPEHFAEAGFIKSVDSGVLVLDYRGMGEDFLQGIKVEHARCVADLLRRSAADHGLLRGAPPDPRHSRRHARCVRRRP